MTLEEAKILVGNQRRSEVKKMVRALQMHPWLNRADDKLRLEAGQLILRHR